MGAKQQLTGWSEIRRFFAYKKYAGPCKIKPFFLTKIIFTLDLNHMHS